MKVTRLSCVETKLLNLKPNGQLMELKAGNDLKMLDVSGIINGSYHIRLFSNENVIITRLIVKK